MPRGELILKVAILLAALVWAVWPQPTTAPPAERSVRCTEARERYHQRPSLDAEDEVHYYCERAR